jgi:hypothetical protein
MTEADGKAERPRLKLPKQRASWLVRGYALFGSAVLVLYVLADVWGFGFDASEKDVLPRSVRQAPGGYRGYALWHSGYQGGK